MTRTITSERLYAAIYDAALAAPVIIREDVIGLLTTALENETVPRAKEVLQILVDNARIARESKLPLCQDTGFDTVFIEAGIETCIDTLLQQVADDAVRKAYKDGIFRSSVVREPFRARENTGDNTPTALHLKQVPGDKVKVTVMPKGGGCDNASTLQMLKPTTTLEEIKDIIVEKISHAGPSACPPFIIGVAIGSTFDQAPLHAKELLVQDARERNSDPELAQIEDDLLQAINDLGIGPSGIGGRTTALKVHVQTYPCHIASLPLAINISCHSLRSATVII